MTAKVLFLDIETAPCLGYTWGVWEQNVIEVKESWYMLSFAYKWMGDKSVTSRTLPDYKLYKSSKSNDRELVKELWQLVNEADVVVAHNGDCFDIKKSNARFIYHDLPPPALYKTVDTLKIARRHFAFLSNKLDALAKHFGIGAKLAHTGFHLWQACMNGDMDAWKMMRRYNVHDVDLLAKVYYKLRAWATNHPNLNLFTHDIGKCPTCMSTHVQRRGYRVAIKRKYERFHCQNCGHWFSGKQL